MKYETAKNLNNTRFKRLIGVAKPVFDEMVKVLKAKYQVKHVFGKVKAYKIFSTTYRNHRRRFNLRMNLICGIISQELAI